MMHLKVRATLTTTATSSMGRAAGGGSLTAPPSGGLLRIPMETLMERVTERRVILRSLQTAATERTAAAAAAEAEKDEDDMDTTEETGSSASSGGGGGDGAAGGGRGERSSKGRAGVGGGALWVDKYAPEGFRDLLSDEKINREVLRAVKAWDPFVFKKEVCCRGCPIL